MLRKFGVSGRRESQVSEILVSRFLTRSGDQAWDFAIPITLVYLMPNRLSLIAFIFLCSKFISVFLHPWVSSAIDKWARFKAASAGICAQAAGVLLVAGIFISLSQNPERGMSESAFLFQVQVIGLIVGTVFSGLGSSLVDISVGNDWIPVLVPEAKLSQINSRLRQIDLVTEAGAPVIAGLVISSYWSGPERGFQLIAAWNILSFAPEIFLLHRVFKNSPLLRSKLNNINLRRTGVIGQALRGWHDFRIQIGFPVMVAYAVLWLSALSPHGVLLTGHLKGAWNLSEVTVGLFRGLGAICGLIATLLFPAIKQKVGLVRSCLIFIAVQAILLLLSLGVFYIEALNRWVFLALILFSRIGLYGFSLGEIEFRQRTIPEGQRGSVNGVASSLTTFATLILFGFGSIVPERGGFQFLMIFSVLAVCLSAFIVYHWAKNNQMRTFL